jgi:DNA-binding beta-propeller fold protein YncE
MHAWIASLFALALGLAPQAAQAPPGPSYHLVREIAIGGEGGWDYILADAAAHRVYVSHATKIVVADTETGAIVGEITDTAGVHGIALAPDLGRGFTSNGRANTSAIVDLKTLATIATVPTGRNPDSIRYLADRREVWTFNHSGGSITVFDPMTGAVGATIQVGGALEEAVEDPVSGRVYVNVEDANAIAVVDAAAHTVVARWPIADCDGPTGLAFDARNHRLIASCDGSTAIVDSTSGKTVTHFPTASRVDGNGFDPASRLAFASSGAGVVTIAHEDAPDRFTVVQTLQTQASGRTMYLDPVTHRLYVPVGTTTPGASGRPQVVAGSMKVLIFAPETHAK